MKRREFIFSTLSGMAATSLAPLPLLSSCKTEEKKQPQAPLKLSLQEWLTVGNNMEERLDFMEENGISGLEVGGGGLANRVDELSKALSNRNVHISAICAGFDRFLLAADEAVKARFDSSIREIVEAAGQLGSCGVIVVPAFAAQSECKPHTMETRKYLCEQLHELGEFAKKCGTTIILEPLLRNFYLRQVSDAAAICRDSDSDGVKCMGDFWHMKEETSDYAAFLSAGTKYLQYVHIASRERRLAPGEDGEKDNYLEGFRALKEMGYAGYVSFECGFEGDRATVLSAACELLRAQWEQA